MRMLRFPRYLKVCAVSVCIFFIIESMILNTIVLCTIWNVRTIFNEIIKAPGATFLDKLAVNPWFLDFVSSGRQGGFAALIKHSIDRIYVESIENNDSKNARKTSKFSVIHGPFQQSSIGKLGIDVSSSGEVLYIAQRIQNLESKRTNWEKLVIDIGANDGLLSSNSYNFIRWGWNAVLVEPQSSQLDLAKRNLNGYTNQHKGQKVQFVNSVISDYDGTSKFMLSPDIASMESHVVADTVVEGAIIDVHCYSVKTFAAKYNVPKLFGILSIDAEGHSSMILHQWIKLGYRPMYIIYEVLHEPDKTKAMFAQLKSAGYIYLIELGWNLIYEYDSKSDMAAVR